MPNASVSEERLKLAVRDVVGRNPLISVHALQAELKDRGFKTAQGNPLDWQYVAKVVRKLNREKALAVDSQKVNERLAETKERYRLVTDRLWKIIDWKPEYLGTVMMFPPAHKDIVAAANAIVKLDLAILKAEMDAGIFDRKLGSVDVNVYRAAMLEPDKAHLIAAAFRQWGVALDLPQQRPKLAESRPADGPSPAAPALDAGQGVRAAP